MNRLTSVEQVFKPTSYQYPHQSNPQTPVYKVDTKDKSIESNAKGKNTERDFSKLRFAIQCNKCQGYWHVAAICPSPIKVNIDELPVTESESDFEEFVYQVEELEDYNSERNSGWWHWGVQYSESPRSRSCDHKVCSCLFVWPPGQATTDMWYPTRHWISPRS